MNGKNIGLFVDFTNNKYLITLIQGVRDRLHEEGYNLICFEGGYLYGTDHMDEARDILYKLATEKNLQGLILPVTSLRRLKKREKLEDFMEKFKNLPTICIGAEVEGYPSIFMDNVSGMSELVKHLICKHRYGNFAFVSGPKLNEDARIREEVFRETLKLQGVDFSEDLYFQGGFTSMESYQVAKQIYKKMENSPIDVIVACNDNAALVIQEYLISKGVKIPQEVAITGFDDSALSLTSDPPLTTVHIPAYAMGKEGALALIQLISGESTKTRYVMDTEPVIRESCGCSPWEAILQRQQGEIDGKLPDPAHEIRRQIERSGLLADQEYDLFYSPLWDLIQRSLDSMNRWECVKAAKGIIADLCAGTANPENQISILPLFFSLVYQCVSNENSKSFIHDISNLIIQIADEMVVRKDNAYLLKMTQLEEAVVQYNRRLMTAHSMEQFLMECGEMLPKMGIVDCLIALREDENSDTFKEMNCVFALKNGIIIVPSRRDVVQFQGEELLPEAIWPKEEWVDPIVYPIINGRKSSGYIIFNNRDVSLDLCERIYTLINYTFSSFNQIEKIQFQHKQLLQSERRLKQAQHIGRIGSWQWDLKNEELIMSQELKRIFLLAENEDPGGIRELINDYVVPEDVPIIHQLWKKEWSELSGQVLEFRISRKDDSVRWVALSMAKTNVKGQSSGLIMGTLQDITQRKTNELELERAERYISNIIDSMPSLLVGVNHEMKIIQWNSQAVSQTGISAHEAYGSALTKVLPQFLGEEGHISNVIANRRKKILTKNYRLNGNEGIFEDIAIYPITAHGETGAVIRVDNVTEQVHMEEIMIQSEKMLSVGGLAAGMAHEINNPLGGMMQTAEVLGQRLMDESMPANIKAAAELGLTMESLRSYMERRKVDEMVQRIRQSGKRAAAIVNNMLSFSRESKNTLKSHDIAEILDRCVELCAVDYNLKKKFDFKRIHIERDYDPALPPLPCDTGKIQQVIMNILRNGAEALWDKGMSQEPHSYQPSFTLRTKLLDQEGLGIIEIEDNGPGMEPHVRKRIFEPFFTTKAIDQGTGLGLSVSYFIITENHNGAMFVESERGQGSKFVIKLPLAGNSNGR